jgi:hypothetical protein
MTVVPSPAMAMTAAQLLDRVREKGGRAHRMRRDRAFVLTDDATLAAWLLDLGARPYANSDPRLGEGAFFRERGGKVEYDIWIDTIPVTGPTVWEALA